MKTYTRYVTFLVGLAHGISAFSMQLSECKEVEPLVQEHSATEQPTIQKQIITIETADGSVQMPWKAVQLSEMLHATVAFNEQQSKMYKDPLLKDRPIDCKDFSSSVVTLFCACAQALSNSKNPTEIAACNIQKLLEKAEISDCFALFKFVDYISAPIFKPILANYLPQAYTQLSYKDGGESVQALINDAQNEALTELGMNDNPLKLFMIKGRILHYQCPSYIDAIDQQKITDARFSNNGQLAALRLQDHNGISFRWVIRETADMANNIIPHDQINGQNIQNVTFDKNNQLIALQLSDNSWVIANTNAIATNPIAAIGTINKQMVVNITFSHDNQFVIFLLENGSCTIRRTNDINTALIPNDQIGGQNIRKIELNCDNQLIVFMLTDNSLTIRKISDINTELIPQNRIYNQNITNITQSPNGQFVAFKLANGSWVFRSTNAITTNLETIGIINNQKISDINFSTDGKFIAFRLTDCSCAIRKTSALTTNFTTFTQADSGKIEFVQFSPTNEFVTFRLTRGSWEDDDSTIIRRTSAVNTQIFHNDQINEKNIRSISYGNQFISFQLADGSSIIRKQDAITTDLPALNQIKGNIQTINRWIESSELPTQVTFSPDSNYLVYLFADLSCVLCNNFQTFPQINLHHVLVAAICEELAKTDQGKAILEKLSPNITACFNPQEAPQTLRSFISRLLGCHEIHTAAAASATATSTHKITFDQYSDH